MGQKRNACRVLVRKPGKKRPPGRPEDGNIKMDLKANGFEGLDRSHVV
jgi:hypothetical protein